MKDYFSGSNEIVNAFIDDELDAEERQGVLNEQVANKQLAEAVCELRILKDMVRAARPCSETLAINVSIPERRSFTRWFVAASAALVMFSLVVSTAWNTNSETNIAHSASRSYNDVAALLQAQSEQQELKLVLHITMMGESAAMNLFKQLDQLLAYSADQDRRVRVQVIASGPGLSLLNKDESPYPEKVRYFSTRYDNVVFVACQRSMLKKAAAQSKAVSILPEALITHSGPKLIKLRQRQGWATIII